MLDIVVPVEVHVPTVQALAVQAAPGGNFQSWGDNLSMSADTMDLEVPFGSCSI